MKLIARWIKEILRRVSVSIAAGYQQVSYYPRNTELRRELLRARIGFSHNPLLALLFKGRRGGHVASLLVVGRKS